jgi:hypothetical protein
MGPQTFVLWFVNLLSKVVVSEHNLSEGEDEQLVRFVRARPRNVSSFSAFDHLGALDKGCTSNLLVFLASTNMKSPCEQIPWIFFFKNKNSTSHFPFFLLNAAVKI